MFIRIARTSFFAAVVILGTALCTQVHAAEPDSLADARIDILSTQFALRDGDASAENEAATIEAPAGNTPPFAEGSWAVQSYGGIVIGDESGELYLGHVGISAYVFDDIAVSFEFVGGGFDGNPLIGQPANDGAVFGANLLLRHHIYKRDRLSIFLDLGAGMLLFEGRYPAGGTHGNFTPQAGMGLTWQLDDRLHLLLGARWHHVSNAFRRGDIRNIGADAGMVYLGLLASF